jgi:hypothetical protein
MREDIKQEWTADLRSGKYKQGKGGLRNPPPENGYCCLGVLCDIISRKPEFQHWQWDGGFFQSIHAHIYNNSTVVANESYVPDSLADAIGLAHHQQRALASFNDQGFSFEQIADKIEAGELGL